MSSCLNPYAPLHHYNPIKHIWDNDFEPFESSWSQTAMNPAVSPASSVALLMELVFSVIGIFTLTRARVRNDTGEQSNTAAAFGARWQRSVNIFLPDVLAPFACLCLNLKVSRPRWRDVLIYTLHSSPPASYLTPSLHISPHLNLARAVTTPSLPLSPSHPPDGRELCVRVCLCAEIVEPWHGWVQRPWGTCAVVLSGTTETRVTDLSGWAVTWLCL